MGIFISNQGKKPSSSGPSLHVNNKRKMIRGLLTTTLVLAATFAIGQKADSAVTQGGAVDVYYSFENGEAAAATTSTWDIALTLAGFDASILINETAGVELFVYGTDVSEWSSVDTSGFDWKNVYNSTETWEEGAFNMGNTGHPDYGWGDYNSGTHAVNGSKIFIVKDRNGDYRQVIIEEMSAPGVFTIKVGDLGGANTASYEVDKNDAAYEGRNYVHFDLSTGNVQNQEPKAADWDILFTKYVTMIPTGPGTFLPYPVNGVKINKGYEVAERNGMDVTSNDTSGLSWNTNITEIGSDWKSFNRTIFQYEMAEDRAYFVRTAEGAVWKIYFTNYKGGQDGTSFFNIEKIRGTASVRGTETLSSSVYPNPATNVLNVRNQESRTLNYALISLQGRTLTGGEIRPGQLGQIQLSELPKGLYILNLQTATASTSKQIVIH
jgi:hypothetical protein